MNRNFNKRQRRILLLISGGVCENCSKPLDNSFHADHILPFSKGGVTSIKNGQALCPACNLMKGSSYEK
jgi:5-methylcytosine-specific restriction endonuclease McrA